MSELVFCHHSTKRSAWDSTGEDLLSAGFSFGRYILSWDVEEMNPKADEVQTLKVYLNTKTENKTHEGAKQD